MQFMMVFSLFKVGVEIFECIFVVLGGLIVFEGGDGVMLINDFCIIVWYFGQVVYLWQFDQGLGSLCDVYVCVFGCQCLGNVLCYMQQSMYFGVYLLVDFELLLLVMDVILLCQLVCVLVGYVCWVVLFDVLQVLVDYLGEVVVKISVWLDLFVCF